MPQIRPNAPAARTTWLDSEAGDGEGSRPSQPRIQPPLDVACRFAPGVELVPRPGGGNAPLQGQP